MTSSEIMKAAHRQAARLVCPGLMSYRQALSIALQMMWRHAKRPHVDIGYDASLCHTLTAAQRQPIFA